MGEQHGLSYWGNSMNYPKVILFDYGNTLLYEPGWDFDKGTAQLMNFITKNPNNYTLKDVKKAEQVLLGTHVENIRKKGYDI